MLPSRREGGAGALPPRPLPEFHRLYGVPPLTGGSLMLHCIVLLREKKECWYAVQAALDSGRAGERSGGGSSPPRPRSHRAPRQALLQRMSELGS